MSLTATGRGASHVEPKPSSRPLPGIAYVWMCSIAVVVGLLLMDVVGGLAYAVAAGLLALVLFGIAYLGRREPRETLVHADVDRRDLVAIAIVYLVVVALYRVAFVVVEDNDLWLFLAFAAGLLVGVGGPIGYTVWIRGRSLGDLGLSMSGLPRVVLLAGIFAGVQFAITLWGYDLPAAREWVTLLGMALMVGIFESIFFRGFVQERLQRAFGTAPAVFIAAALYGAYHVGYGMGLEESVFLTGLGIVYALAYVAAENVLVLWPLLTPMGSLFAQLESGDLAGRLPWAALLGFADVMAIMATMIWLAHRHERKQRSHPVRVAFAA